MDTNSITLRSDDQSTQLTCYPTRGALIRSLRMNCDATPRELLFEHDFFDNAHWSDLPGGLPFLFPVCARLERDSQPGAYLYNGQLYTLDIHGFSWQTAWEVIDQLDDMCRLRLRSTADTKAHYPFNFEVLLRYQVKHNTFICHQSYTNRGDEPMPFYAGFHPYFLMPNATQGKADTQLTITPSHRLQYNDRMTDIIGSQAPLAFPHSLGDPALNEQLHYVGENNRIKLTFPDKSELHIETDGIESDDPFQYVQTYTMADKPFFCVEPWMAFPNAMNTIQGVHWLEPGANRSAQFTLYLQQP